MTRRSKEVKSKKKTKNTSCCWKTSRNWVIENARLKKEPKGKASNPSKRIKIEKDKKTKELQKEIESLKKQVCQIKEEATKASSKWKEKYVVDTEKHKRENAKIKILLQAKKIKQVELRNENQALQSTFQYYNKTS